MHVGGADAIESAGSGILLGRTQRSTAILDGLVKW